MSQTIYQVDSFTAVPFKGNPAGVCVLKKAASESWMKDIAAEMNLSETAFLYPSNKGYSLRWFTPEAEVELCGHATLAAAHILWEKEYVSRDKEIVFHTLSGALTAVNLNKGIELNFPATPPEETSPPEGLLNALGIESASFVGKSKFDYLLELESVDQVKKLSPNFSDLRKVSARGVMVTAADDSGEYDFISRFFAPAFGIDEDPVTGSAYCTLTPYWSKKLNKIEMKAYQASKRGGEVNVILDADRVRLGGQAVTVFKIKLRT